MNKLKYEQMNSENKENNDDDLVLGNGGTGITIDKVKRINKKNQSIKRLLIIIGFSLLILLLIIIVIVQSSKYSKLQSSKTEFSRVYTTLKRQEDEAQRLYNKLLDDNQKLLEKQMEIDKQIEKYNTKQNQHNEQIERENEQLKTLENDYDKENKKVKQLQSQYEELKKRITDLEEQSFTYENDIEELNKRVLELQSKLNLNQKNAGSNDKLNESGISSQIVHTNKEMQFLNDALPNSKFVLIYRKSRDGFDPNVFHRKCDDANRTLTLIQITSNEFRYVIGGYTSRSWRANHPRMITMYDSDAFLFNLSLMIKYKVVRDDEAIICNPNKFVVFNTDLSIGQFEINSSFPYAYESPHKNRLGLTCGYETMSSDSIEEMEVYEVLQNR